MNERIRELSKQAGYKPLSPPTFADELNEIFMRKFAELIVRECVGVVEGGRFLHDDAPAARFARECSGAIKRHFGVAE